MRIAFISDIHGNFTALTAVLTDIESQKVDRIISLGDVATLGPQPLEVLTRLQEVKVITIRGNHDQALLDPANIGKYQITEHLSSDITWCRNLLSQEHLAFIESFAHLHEFAFPNGITVLCYHGSPRSTTDLILSTTASDILDNFFASRTADVFIGGHSHIQMSRRHGEKLILNAGSVGNAFRYAYEHGTTPSLVPWAEYILLSQGDSFLNVDMRRVYFDTDELMKQVAQSGLPGAEWWMRQYPSRPQKVIR